MFDVLIRDGALGLSPHSFETAVGVSNIRIMNQFLKANCHDTEEWLKIESSAKSENHYPLHLINRNERASAFARPAFERNSIKPI
jgi:hypothetical protein